MLELLKQLDGVRLNFSPQGLLAINITLAFIMFGVALGIKPVDFRRIFRDPKPAVTGIISQFVLLPMITFLFVILLRNYITPTVAFGMILVASCPGGNISNFMSSLAKGNAALSVSLTAFATLAAILLTPLNFSLWGGFYVKYISTMDASLLLRPLKIDAFEMFKTVFVLLGIPLAMGMLFSFKFPKTTVRINKPIKLLSILFFSAIVVLSFSKNYGYFIGYIQYIFIFVLIHNALALFTGFVFASALKLPKADIRTITIETGIQNSGLGLILLFNPQIFPKEMAIGGMAFIVAWWAIWHILSGLTVAGIWSYKTIKE
jgi:bile acid:Na+ symporter, BASS family